MSDSDSSGGSCGCMGCGLFVFLLVLATGGSIQGAAKWGLAIWVGPLTALMVFLVLGALLAGGFGMLATWSDRRSLKKWDKIR